MLHFPTSFTDFAGDIEEQSGFKDYQKEENPFPWLSSCF